MPSAHQSHDEDLCREGLLRDLAYILCALAQNFSGETKSEIGMLTKRLQHIRPQSPSAVLAAQIAIKLEEAKSPLMLELEPGRIATAQSVWECYERVRLEWDDYSY